MIKTILTIRSVNVPNGGTLSFFRFALVVVFLRVDFRFGVGVGMIGILKS